jgi:hypothetical protein
VRVRLRFPWHPANSDRTSHSAKLFACDPESAGTGHIAYCYGAHGLDVLPRPGQGQSADRQFGGELQSYFRSSVLVSTGLASLWLRSSSRAMRADRGLMLTCRAKIEARAAGGGVASGVVQGERPPPRRRRIRQVPALGHVIGDHCLQEVSGLRQRFFAVVALRHPDLDIGEGDDVATVLPRVKIRRVSEWLIPAS